MSERKLSAMPASAYSTLSRAITGPTRAFFGPTRRRASATKLRAMPEGLPHHKRTISTSAFTSSPAPMTARTIAIAAVLFCESQVRSRSRRATARAGDATR